MWKKKEREGLATASPPQQPLRAGPVDPVFSVKSTAKEVFPVETPKPLPSLRVDIANIGKSVLIKGELSGSEDLYLDGEVEGSIELRGHNLTVGPNGRIRASINAREVVVQGKVDGNVHAERVELKKSAICAGDIVTQYIAVEEGAYFKGGIDIVKDVATPAAKPEAKPESTQAVAAAMVQSPLLDGRK